ncbi:MAG TPA: hypothetical protein VFT61_06335, partial [Sphingomicrobium sp.]|nr:hypothetical protein [Sphingomicrobium sp.]
EYAANVSGKLASFGYRMLDGIVRMLLANFFDRLRGYVRGEGPPTGFAGRLRGLMNKLKLIAGRR